MTVPFIFSSVFFLSVPYFITDSIYTVNCFSKFVFFIVTTLYERDPFAIAVFDFPSFSVSSFHCFKGFTACPCSGFWFSVAKSRFSLLDKSHPEYTINFFFSYSWDSWVNIYIFWESDSWVLEMKVENASPYTSLAWW